jgi:hypothetical protein
VVLARITVSGDEDFAEASRLDVAAEHPVEVADDPLVERSGGGAHRDLAIEDLVTAAVGGHGQVVLVGEHDAVDRHRGDSTPGMARSIGAGHQMQTGAPSGA